MLGESRKKVVLEAHFSGAHFAEGRTRATHLVVIRAQDDPATEGVTQVDHPGAGTEAKHLWQGGLHCQNEHLKRPSSAGGVTRSLLEPEEEMNLNPMTRPNATSLHYIFGSNPGI